VVEHSTIDPGGGGSNPAQENIPQKKRLDIF
jgi:hypothetical protein